MFSFSAKKNEEYKMDNLNSRVALHNCPIFIFNVCNFMMEQPDVEEKRYNRI